MDQGLGAGQVPAGRQDRSRAVAFPFSPKHGVRHRLRRDNPDREHDNGTNESRSNDQKDIPIA
jgi:hypothetical protein